MTPTPAQRRGSELLGRMIEEGMCTSLLMPAEACRNARPDYHEARKALGWKKK